MKAKMLSSHESLITAISDEVRDLALILEIPFRIDNEDDHIYIKEAFLPLELDTFYTRRATDVMVSSKVFCEILMDVKSGLSILEAYKKQGYTF